MITAEEQESSAEINAVHDLFCEEMEKLSLDNYNKYNNGDGDGDGEGEGENDLSARALMQQRGMTEFQMRLAAAVGGPSSPPPCWREATIRKKRLVPST